MKIDKIEYIAVKETARLNKSGERKTRESAYIFRFRIDGAWKIAREIDGEMREKFAPFMFVFSRIDAALAFPSAFKAAGLSVPQAVTDGANAAKDKRAAILKKREERERETIENGRGAFMRKNAKSGAARWEKLCDKYGVENTEN